jgi:hypothetical protein
MKVSSSLERFPQLFASLAVLSLSLVVSSFIFANAIRDFKQANDVLVVTGSAKRPIQSDYIILRFSLSSQEPTAQAAYQNLKRQTERVQAYLKEQEVPDDAITLSAIETYAIPEVAVNGREQVMYEMVAEATKDALARAEAIASSTGNRVGTVRSAQTGVFQITSRNSTDVSDYGIYDTSSLEKDITAVVSVKLGMEPAKR